MAVTFQQLLDRSEELATNIAGDAQTSPLIDSEVTAEVIYPHAVRSVFRDYAKTGRHLDDMQMNHSISLTGDSGTLPDNVIRECLDHAYIPRDQFASKVPYEDYGRYRYDNQMCYFAIKGGSIYYSCWSDLKSTGTWYFLRNPVQGETIVINGITFTFTYPVLTVAGGGQTDGNGEFTGRGVYNTYPYWNKLGENTNVGNLSIAKGWITNGGDDGLGFWELANDDFQEAWYVENEDGTQHTHPEDVTLWTSGGDSTGTGTAPSPTVTRSVITPITAVQVEIGLTADETATNFAAALNASTNAAVTPATYTALLSTERGASGTTVTGIYDEATSAGNSYTMAASSAGAVTVSGATFTGGGALVLNTPGIPTAPTAGSDVLTFSPAIIDDIVMKIASVLRGEIALNALIGGNDVRK